jgi:hypothetical protein
MLAGLIDTERVRGMMGSGDADSVCCNSSTVRRHDCTADRARASPSQRIDPNAIAETFLNLAQQPRSCWTHGARS